MGLDDDPFDYRITKCGSVLVSRGGRLVVTVGGARAARLTAALGRDARVDQEPPAWATGNHRRGTERRPGRG